MTHMVTYAHDREAAIGSIGTLKRQLAHGWASDWRSLRARGDLGEGVGDGLVPVHVLAAGAQVPGALFA